MPEDLQRYAEEFGEPFPLMVWHGTDADLAAAVDEAIAAGEPWDEDGLLEFQGLDPLPEGALV